MGLHHVAYATKDIDATHAFYTEVMGFRLVKIVAGATDAGWSKHVFYDTGGQGLIAFWDLHDEEIGDNYRTDLSKSLGLPIHINHIAFDAHNLEELAAIRERWQQHGITVTEIDHGFCTSIYTVDPNKILVEFCCDTLGLSEEDAVEAERLLRDPQPELEPEPPMTIHRPLTSTQ
jgi:catechol 2,3-dioxygenase-like lactoylglutathione lyase family enzyme